MRNKWAVFILFWLVTGVRAQVREKFVEEYDPFNDRISDDLEAGAYLMYDCEKKYYVCVLEEYYRACEAKRLEESKSTSETFSCAPFGKLATKKSCFQRQLFMVGHNVATPSCTKEALRPRDLFFN